LTPPQARRRPLPRFDLIAHEDLNIRGLARSTLAKSVSDIAWVQFITTLHIKAEEAGVHVVAVDPRALPSDTPSTRPQRRPAAPECARRDPGPWAAAVLQARQR